VIQYGRKSAAQLAILSEASNAPASKVKPWEFKRGKTRGEINANWIEEHCRIPEGKFVGQRVKLREWQRTEIRAVYDNPAVTRRYISSRGRKNAKTAQAAFHVLLHLCGPEAKRRPNSDLYSAAQSRDQAGILFSLAAKMVRMSPSLLPVVGVRDTAKQLYCPALGTTYRALSAEAPTAYGLSPALCVHDELGQVRGPRSTLYEALETAAGAQHEPLSIIISTQAPTDGDLLSILIDDAKTGADPHTVLFLYTADETLDPFSDEALAQANPALGDFLNAAEVRSQAESARRMPAREAAFRNLVLNQRVNLSNPFIARGVWDACNGRVSEKAFERAAWIGLDLSEKADLTACVMVGQDAKGAWHVRPEFFAPEKGVHDRSHRDRVPYDVWAKQGFLTLTPGASVDYGFVAEHLAELCAQYPVKGVAFDRWHINLLRSELDKIGATVPLAEFGQGFRDMTPALAVLEHELLEENVRHAGHPVLTMCAANAVVTRDAAGNRKLDKAKSTGRIDGAVALAMALGRAAANEGERKFQVFVVG
jgi:phage terminase large subunit-like protein